MTRPIASTPQTRNCRTQALTLERPDQLNKQWQATRDVRKVVARNTNPDGSVNVAPLNRQLTALRYSKRGDRVADFLGGDKDAADEFMGDLQAAQAKGVQAMKVQKIAGKIGKYGAAAAGLDLLGRSASALLGH